MPDTHEQPEDIVTTIHAPTSSVMDSLRAINPEIADAYRILRSIVNEESAPAIIQNMVASDSVECSHGVLLAVFAAALGEMKPDELAAALNIHPSLAAALCCYTAVHAVEDPADILPQRLKIDIDSARLTHNPGGRPTLTLEGTRKSVHKHDHKDSKQQ